MFFVNYSEWTILALLIISYLVGSVTFGPIIAGKKIDLTKLGSGNVGATNVFRVCGWKAGLTVLLLDMMKGFIPVYISWCFFDVSAFYAVLIAAAVIVGHSYPVYSGFKKGGKSVATAGGVFLALMPVTFFIALAIFGLIYIISKYISAGSLAAALFILLSQVVQAESWQIRFLPITVLTLLACTLIIYRHRGNVKRLIKGTESKLYL